MATNLTGLQIASTYTQLLHIDGGPTGSEKTVYSALGIPTALKVGTGSVSVDNLKLDGNTLSTTNTNGNLVLSPNGSGAVTIAKATITGGSVVGITDLAVADGGTGASDAPTARANLGLGTMATQSASAVAITGGAISGVSFAGALTGVVSIDAGTLSVVSGGDGLSMTDNTLSSAGASTNIDINLTPKGSGAVVVENIDVQSGAVPFSTITGRAYGVFYDAGTAAQAGSTSVVTPVKVATTTTAVGVSVASNSRVTVTTGGVYRVSAQLQFANADSGVRLATVLLRVDGADVAASTRRVSVPATSSLAVGLDWVVSLSPNNYVEVCWLSADTDVTLAYTAAGTSPVTPVTPPATIMIDRIA